MFPGQLREDRRHLRATRLELAKSSNLPVASASITMELDFFAERFNRPDKTRAFEKGCFERIRIS